MARDPLLDDEDVDETDEDGKLLFGSERGPRPLVPLPLRQLIKYIAFCTFGAYANGIIAKLTFIFAERNEKNKKADALPDLLHKVRLPNILIRLCHGSSGFERM